MVCTGVFSLMGSIYAVRSSQKREIKAADVDHTGVVMDSYDDLLVHWKVRLDAETERADRAEVSCHQERARRHEVEAQLERCLALLAERGERPDL